MLQSNIINKQINKTFSYKDVIINGVKPIIEKKESLFEEEINNNKSLCIKSNIIFDDNMVTIPSNKINDELITLIIENKKEEYCKHQNIIIENKKVNDNVNKLKLKFNKTINVDNVLIHNNLIEEIINDSIPIISNNLINISEIQKVTTTIVDKIVKNKIIIKKKNTKSEHITVNKLIFSYDDCFSSIDFIKLKERMSANLNTLTNQNEISDMTINITECNDKIENMLKFEDIEIDIKMFKKIIAMVPSNNFDILLKLMSILKGIEVRYLQTINDNIIQHNYNKIFTYYKNLHSSTDIIKYINKMKSHLNNIENQDSKDKIIRSIRECEIYAISLIGHEDAQTDIIVLDELIINEKNNLNDYICNSLSKIKDNIKIRHIQNLYDVEKSQQNNISDNIISKDILINKYIEEIIINDSLFNNNSAEIKKNKIIKKILKIPDVNKKDSQINNKLLKSEKKILTNIDFKKSLNKASEIIYDKVINNLVVAIPDNINILKNWTDDIIFSISRASDIHEIINKKEITYSQCLKNFNQFAKSISHKIHVHAGKILNNDLNDHNIFINITNTDFESDPTNLIFTIKFSINLKQVL